MLAFKARVRDMALSMNKANRQIEAVPVQGSERALAVVVDGMPTVTTNWAFGQLAQRAGAPGPYLRSLRPDLAADCINYGMAKREVEDVGVYIHRHDESSPVPIMAAVTGPQYGRISDASIIEALIARFGNGRDGDFTVPGEFGEKVAVTKANTTLYASDRDMFVFLADEKNRIEVPDRRNGEPGMLARGFFVQNSEVGSAALSITTFLFDYVCCNRIVWGAADMKNVTIRHTSGAPIRFLEEVAPALELYAHSSAQGIVDGIAAAKAKRLEEVEDFLSERFSRSQAKAIILAHEVDEARPIETIWDAVVGITAYARELPNQDNRVDFERAAGKVMKLAA
ncbi:MAG TPA: DUF932 domain-containing protein [Caulobacteraceae bacterium]